MFQICRRVFSIVVIVVQLLQHEALYIMASQIQMERCPTMCTCDIYKELNRANCSGQHLISADIEISSFVEWLDLSNNDITTIDSQCFYEIHRLSTLLLDRNSISFIDLDAFVTLTRLKTINLANNRLESFDNRIFEENPQLTNVDLSVNKFMHLPNEPILKSKSLQTLDLHESFLTHLHVKYFEELPNVRSIDLSGNLLIVLNLAAFAVNNRLQELNINENRMKCDAQMEMSIVWLRRNNVRVNGNTCPKKPTNISWNPKPMHAPPPIFERMRALPNPMEMSTINATETPIDLSSVWKIKKYSANAPILDEECLANEVNTNACHLFKMCASNLTVLIMVIDQKIRSKNRNPNDMNTNYNNLSNSQHTGSEFITMQVAFYGGLFLGAMLGAIALFTIKLILDCVRMTNCGCDGSASNKRKRNRHHHSHKTEIRCNDADRLNGSTEDNINQNHLTSPINYENDENSRIHPQQSSTSIFAILYERPVRRRYYRQFNRNATNLVRRWSQSRLFLNSSRAQNANNRTNTRSHHHDNNNNNNQHHHQSNIVQASESNRQNILDRMDTENDIEFDRNVNQMADVDDEHEIMLLPTAQAQLHNNDCISVHSLNIIIHDNINTERENQLNLNRHTFASSETDIIRHCVARIETPPPPYDIVAE